MKVTVTFHFNVCIYNHGRRQARTVVSPLFVMKLDLKTAI